MPVSVSSRSSAYTTTPTKTAFSRAMSPASTSSYAPTIISTGQTVKMNVVTRVAVEGRAKQGEEGASIKMYMKLSIPVDSVVPGSTISLFPEENIKILTSQIHPLDNNSAPYHFVSSAYPLLHNAARALNLPARSSTTFSEAFHLNPVPNAATPTYSTDVDTPPIDPQYTGQILVSGYQIAFVLPRYFPSREQTPMDFEPDRSSYTPQPRRRLSIGERNHAHFMAAVDMWVPYTTRPPRYPYLLSIPIPRCLHNSIKLRIFPPSNTAASFASLSSIEDDTSAWDLISDPHVTRTTSSRLSRTSSYNSFADDESSDSSTAGFADGVGIQGTFPSTDRVRVRWAKPIKTFDVGEGASDTRRRVGVKEVKSEMTCIVRGKQRSSYDDGPDGIIMDVEYKATCKGIWFPGVATLLGMEVGLMAKNSDVSWTAKSSAWDVSAGTGYTGFNVNGSDPFNRPSVSRITSTDSSIPQMDISSSLEELRRPGVNGWSRHNSASSTASLLRGPLPSDNVPEYSFENSGEQSVTSSHLTSLSSVPSLSQSGVDFLPGAPLMLHLNMNDLLPPSRVPFTFTINGIIVVTPRTTPRRDDVSFRENSLGNTEISDPISLPHFTILAADAETTQITVHNGIEELNASVEVYSPSGDIYKDPQARKTVLQKGGSTRCGRDGGRIALKIIGDLPDNKINDRLRMLMDHPRSKTPQNSAQVHDKPKARDAPMLIPSVTAIITPFTRHHSVTETYAVRVCMTAPVSHETGWLEFGFRRVDPSLSRPSLLDNGDTFSPIIHITGASVAGRPVKHEITDFRKYQANSSAPQGPSFESMGVQEWSKWVKVQVGQSDGSDVILDYLVQLESSKSSLPWLPNRKGQQLDILLPAFTQPVGSFKVKIYNIKGITCLPVDSNLEYQSYSADGPTLFHFSQEELFSPRLSLTFEQSESRYLSLWFWSFVILLCCTLFVTRNKVLAIGTRDVGQYFKGPGPSTASTEYLEAITVTTTSTATVTHTIVINPILDAQTPITSSDTNEPLSPTSATPTLAIISTPIPETPIPTPTTTISLVPSPSHLTPSINTYTSILRSLGLEPAFNAARSISQQTKTLLNSPHKLIQYSGPLKKIWGVLWRIYNYPLDPP